MSTVLVAKHYGETETRISNDPKTVKLFCEYLVQGGTIESLDNSMLTINKEAYKRGIEASHIGAVVEAFKLIYKRMQDEKRDLYNTTENDGFTKDQISRLQKMAEKGILKYVKL